MQPVYDKVQEYDENRKIVGYKIDSSLSVKVRNISVVGKVIDTVFDAGANRFNNVRFAVSNLEAIKGELLKEAVEDGYKKARIVANMSGSTIGVLLNASIVDSTMNRISQDNVYTTVMATAEETEIFVGNMSISVNVNLAYTENKHNTNYT